MLFGVLGLVLVELRVQGLRKTVEGSVLVRVVRGLLWGLYLAGRIGTYTLRCLRSVSPILGETHGQLPKLRSLFVRLSIRRCHMLYNSKGPIILRTTTFFGPGRSATGKAKAGASCPSNSTAFAWPQLRHFDMCLGLDNLLGLGLRV